MELKKMSKLDLKGAIVGMQLGDGCIKERGTFHSYSICKNYINFKSEILSNLTNVHFGMESNRRNSYGNNVLYNVSTNKHPFYVKLRMRAYHNGKRVVDPHLIKSLTPLGLLIWYLDDGCVDRSCGMKFQIHSNAYSYLEHLFLKKMLNDKFGLRFNIRKSFKKNRSKIYYWLYLKCIDRLKFYDQIIAPYIHFIPKEMMYKIPTREDIEIMMNSKSHCRFYKEIV